MVGKLQLGNICIHFFNHPQTRCIVKFKVQGIIEELEEGRPKSRYIDYHPHSGQYGLGQGRWILQGVQGSTGILDTPFSLGWVDGSSNPLGYLIPIHADLIWCINWVIYDFVIQTCTSPKGGQFRRYTVASERMCGIAACGVHVQVLHGQVSKS